MTFKIHCFTLSGIEQVARFKRDGIKDIAGVLALDIPLEFWRLDNPPSAKRVQIIKDRSKIPTGAKLRFSVLNGQYENTCHWIMTVKAPIAKRPEMVF